MLASECSYLTRNVITIRKRRKGPQNRHTCVSIRIRFNLASVSPCLRHFNRYCCSTWARSLSAAASLMFIILFGCRRFLAAPRDSSWNNGQYGYIILLQFKKRDRTPFRRGFYSRGFIRKSNCCSGGERRHLQDRTIVNREGRTHPITHEHTNIIILQS